MSLTKNDPEVAKYIHLEQDRQEYGLEMIASENYVSKDVLEAQGSILTNKYAEGYPGKRYYGGCEFVDHLEQLAIDRAKKLFGAEHANVQPHSGSQANMATFWSRLLPAKPSWEWIFRTAGISLMARRSILAERFTKRYSTGSTRKRAASTTI